MRTTYLCTLRAHPVWVQHKVCKLLGPVAHIQAPVFAFGILVLEVLQLFHHSDVADKLLNNLKDSGFRKKAMKLSSFDSCTPMQQGKSAGRVLQQRLLKALAESLECTF